MFSFASLLIVLCWAGVNVILQFQFLAEALSLNGLNYLCLRLLKVAFLWHSTAAVDSLWSFVLWSFVSWSLSFLHVNSLTSTIRLAIARCSEDRQKKRENPFSSEAAGLLVCVVKVKTSLSLTFSFLPNAVVLFMLSNTVLCLWQCYGSSASKTPL